MRVGIAIARRPRRAYDAPPFVSVAAPAQIVKLSYIY